MSTPLPRYKLIEDNEFMDAGCLYQFKDLLLRCTSSGVFSGVRGVESKFEKFTVNDNIVVTDRSFEYLSENDEVIARGFSVSDDMIRWEKISAAFDIVSRTADSIYNPEYNQLYIPPTSVYDPTTHRYLGEYLRYIKNKYDLNLMPLYNCFSGEQLVGYYFDNNNELVSSSNHIFDVYLVPIKYNKVYTIALDSDTPIRIVPLFYNQEPLYYPSDNTKYLYKSISLKDESGRDYSSTVYSNMSYNEPVTFSVDSFQFKDPSYPYTKAITNESCLYLAIQVPKLLKSSITVLEGDFSKNGSRIVSDVLVTEPLMSSSSRLDSIMVSRLSLLQNTEDTMCPFANRLTEYLLQNTIDERTQNVSVVSALQKRINFHTLEYGFWSDALRFQLYDAYLDVAQKYGMNTYDILGYVDSDVERAINKGLIKLG